MAPPKTGPRGFNIGDVQKVAAGGSSAMPREATPTPSQPVPNAMDLVNYLAGGAQTGYGQKYGGLQTTTNLTNAIRGNVYNWVAFRDQLAAELAAREAPINEAYAASLERIPSTTVVAPTPRTTELQNQLSQLARARAQARYRFENPPAAADEGSSWKKPLVIGSTALGIAGAPFTGGASLLFPLAVGGTLAGGQVVERAGGTGTGFLAEPIRQAQYAQEQRGLATDQLVTARNLDRLQTQALLNQRAEAEAQTKAAEEAKAVGLAELEPAKQLVQELQNIPLSQYAQMVATRQFGVNPAVAAGQFGPGFDIAMDAEQEKYNRLGQPDTSKTTAEIVLERGGEEALQQYYDQQYLSAVNGTLEDQINFQQEQQDVQNALIDRELNANLGITPGMIYANREEANALRQAMVDPQFIADIQSTLPGAVQSFNEGATSDEVAADVYRSYYETTGDELGAKYMADIVASFLI